MEEDLGTTLFLRNQKGVALTPTGQLLLPVAQRTFTEFSQLRKDVSALKKRPHLTGSLQIFSSDMVSYSVLSNMINHRKDKDELSKRGCPTLSLLLRRSV